MKFGIRVAYHYSVMADQVIHDTSRGTMLETTQKTTDDLRHKERRRRTTQQELENPAPVGFYWVLSIDGKHFYLDHR